MSQTLPLLSLSDIDKQIRACREELSALRRLRRYQKAAQEAQEARAGRRAPALPEAADRQEVLRAR